MSTKSTIYHQKIDEKGNGYLHVYHDCSGVYRERGIHIDVGSDVVFVKDPAKLIDELTRVWPFVSDEYAKSS